MNELMGRRLEATSPSEADGVEAELRRRETPRADLALWAGDDHVEQRGRVEERSTKRAQLLGNADRSF
jgi:hypothetical protein